MDKIKKLKFYIDSLCVYNVKEDEVVSKLRCLLENAGNEEVFKCCAEFINALTKNGDSLKHYISELIVFNDNAFTRAAASNKNGGVSEVLIRCAESDLEKLEAVSEIRKSDFLTDSNREILSSLPDWETGKAIYPLESSWKNSVDALISYHEENGWGVFAKYSAFSWKNGDFSPIASVDKIRLTDLKNYDRQREQVVENTLAFLAGFPANNVLLYGDRGTGKSSTVHAILNEYKSRGLRIVEISKGDISDLTLIRDKLFDNPMKFIIFIDDLSFDKKEDSFSELKAALEGTLSKREENAVIYATSNRRHLVKENFTDRENDVHMSDTIQEELSLSDRFGLAINFMNPDKNDYLDIVLKIAQDRSFSFDEEDLLSGAEQWARRRGGRSPRCAKQYIDYLESSKKMVKD
ncbi:MAG: ATP-binding protein [Ruminococcaceae bacterium]|nr:ATP-binding protein [Oscillospiraceae bacterium]